MKFFGAFALFALAAAGENKIHWTALTGRATGGIVVNKVASLAPATVQYVQAAPALQSLRAVAVQPQVQYVQLQPQAVQYVQAQPQVQYVQVAQAPVAVARVAQVAQVAQGPIIGAVESTRTVQVVDGPSAAPAAPQSIVIPPSVQALDFEFQSQSSPLNVRQTHIPGRAAETQESAHEEPADVLRQKIVKPIVHEIHEAIQPIRRISQEVRPVQETVNQVLTRGQAQAAPVAVQQVQVQAVRAVQPVQAVRAVQVQAVQPVQVQAVRAVQAVPVQTLNTVQIARPLKYVTAQIARPAVVALNTLGHAQTTGLIDGGVVSGGLINGGVVSGGVIDAGLVNGGTVELAEK